MHYIWKSSAWADEQEQYLFYRIPDSEGITIILYLFSSCQNVSRIPLRWKLAETFSLRTWWLSPRGLRRNVGPGNSEHGYGDHQQLNEEHDHVQCSDPGPALFTHREWSFSSDCRLIQLFEDVFTSQCTKVPWEVFCFCYTSSQIMIDVFSLFLFSIYTWWWITEQCWHSHGHRLSPIQM